MRYSRSQIIDALQNIAQIGSPSSGAATIVDIGTQNFLEYFENEVLNNFIAQGGSTCRFFEGAYGTGKTHVLQLLHDMAIKRQMPFVEVELSNALNFTNWHSITKFILEKIQCCIDGKVVRSLPRILDAMVTSGWVLEKPLKSFNLPHRGFVNAIETYLKRNRNLNPDAKDKLVQFLMGQRVGTVELQRYGITGVKNPLSRRNAELVLNTVLSALYYLKFPGTIILFDEIDQTFINTLPPSRRTMAAANIMRRLIDACSLSGIKGVLVAFAVLLNFIPACSNAYQALGERLMVSSMGRSKHGWRTPVLRLDAICSISDREEFVEAAVDKFIELARVLGIDKNLRPFLETAGEDILNRHAGLDFRRPLVRRYASMVLEHT
jgi:hypothetical protein